MLRLCFRSGWRQREKVPIEKRGISPWLHSQVKRNHCTWNDCSTEGGTVLQFHFFCTCSSLSTASCYYALVFFDTKLIIFLFLLAGQILLGRSNRGSGTWFIGSGIPWFNYVFRAKCRRSCFWHHQWFPSFFGVSLGELNFCGVDVLFNSRWPPQVDSEFPFHCALTSRLFSGVVFAKGSIRLSIPLSWAKCYWTANCFAVSSSSSTTPMHQVIPLLSSCKSYFLISS